MLISQVFAIFYMKNFYLDTNIWIDYFQNRTDGLRPIGEFAFLFIKNCINFDCKIIYSDLILFELNKVIEEKMTKQLIEQHKLTLVYVKTQKNDFYEAKKLSNSSQIHFQDALHANNSKTS